MFATQYAAPLPKERVGFSSIPDFLFPTLDGFVDVLEIKVVERLPRQAKRGGSVRDRVPLDADAPQHLVAHLDGVGAQHRRDDSADLPAEPLPLRVRPPSTPPPGSPCAACARRPARRPGWGGSATLRT